MVAMVTADGGCMKIAATADTADQTRAGTTLVEMKIVIVTVIATEMTKTGIGGIALPMKCHRGLAMKMQNADATGTDRCPACTEAKVPKTTIVLTRE